MIREWIEPIYNRTYESVRSVQSNPDQINPDGCWNAVDLNRIEHNTAYCAEWMVEQKIVRTPPSITVREDDYWTNSIIPTKSEIDRILNNIRLLIEISSTNPAIADQLPNIYAATQINYVLANEIEFALDLMHTQPKLPLEYKTVKLTNGLIKSITRVGGTVEIINSSEALVAEDEIVTIVGVEYGEYAQYQTFTYWSGNADDIGLLEDYKAKETIFEMPYGRDIAFTANFETHIPRTLTINSGYISINKDPAASTGPSTKTYFAGEEVMIIANVASSGKAFYEWTGTEEALDKIVGVTSAEDPSTAILTMPDCDVTLTPHYINAGMHTVTVNQGSGGGLYNYKDYVSIYANVPNHYAFSHWSGPNTNYLNDIYSSAQSFRMGDENITFTANFIYVYSYNDVQIINGLIRVDGTDVSKAQSLRQDSPYTLVPTPPNSTQGIDYWSIEGEGRIETDYLGNQTNTFRVGDGNAIITGHYNTLQAMTLENVNNSNESTISQIVQGHKVRVNTTEIVGDYIFQNWTVDGIVVSSSTIYDFTMPTKNITIRANYRLRNQVQITINYGLHVETVIMQERSSKSIVADANPQGVQFLRWNSSNLYRVNSVYSANTTFIAGSEDGTIDAIYENYHTLTVNAGSGSGTIIEGNSQIIDANQPPATYEFDYWEINSGNGTIDNIYSKRTTFRMNTTDTEITAHYKPIPYFTVTIENGYVWDGSNWVTNATLLRNSQNAITLKQGSVPIGQQFLQWEVYENGILQTNANDVYEPFAETTRLRDLLRNITIKATYYTPDTETKYTLTIVRKDGSADQNEYPAGTDITIHASYPDQGMEFLKWEGDTAYIAGGVTHSESYIHMPAQNIQITETYVPEGYIPEYKIEMKGLYGECCYTTEYTDPETGETTVTEHWTTMYEHYHQEDIVKIRATGFDAEYYFDSWNAYNHDTETDARSVITKLDSSETTLTMPDYDLDIEPNILLKKTYELRVNDGGTSAYYYEGARADVYFGKEDTNDIHYIFTRWTGDNISKLELWDGGMFDVTIAGSNQNPQYVKTLGERTELTPIYKSLYRLTLTNGSISDTEKTQDYYEAGTTISITANPAPSGMKFQYWSGETDGIANRYDPTTTVTTVAGTTSIVAVYSTDEEQNSIGYVTSDLKSVTTINNNDITIISGEIKTGFILSDIGGHIYIVTNVNEGNSTIYRMTRIVKGGNTYG